MADYGKLLKNWRVALALLVLLLAISVIAVRGINYGLDFQGGTLFQLHLAEAVDESAKLERIRATIQQRLDWSGLKNADVKTVGNQLVFAQLAETNPEQIGRLESLLLKQGKFEATIDGNVIFTGSDFIEISNDPAKGYGYSKIGDYYEWTLPFVLSETAAKDFTRMTFHRCRILSYDQTAGKQYECDRTYFFIDRPSGSIAVMPSSLYYSDSETLKAGKRVEDIPPQTTVEEVFNNAQMPFILYDGSFKEEDLNRLSLLSQNYNKAFVPPNTPESITAELESKGFEVKQTIIPENIPWAWHVTGIRQIIMLSEDVTNVEPYVSSLDSPNLKTYSALIIRGSAATTAEAQQRLENLNILLQSGSLPVAVDSISKETISPSLGKSFLFGAGIIGIVAAVLVALVLYIRYRVLKLIAPMMFTVLSEIAMITGISSLLNIPLDLAAITGIIAAVGTGVDDQIVITDELIKGASETEVQSTTTQRVKRAFFIVIAAAAASIATMLPIILLGQGSGMARLIGFAITTIIGVLIGVLITRPAFGEIAKILMQ